MTGVVVKLRGAHKAFRRHFDSRLKHNATRLGPAPTFNAIWLIAPPGMLVIPVYCSPQIFYYGAEFNAVPALVNGDRLHQLPRAGVDE